MRKTNILIEKLGDKLKAIDSYGFQFNLLINEERTYKTRLGGIATLITQAILLAYFISLIIQVASKEATIKTV